MFDVRHSCCIVVDVRRKTQEYCASRNYAVRNDFTEPHVAHTHSNSPHSSTVGTYTPAVIWAYICRSFTKRVLRGCCIIFTNDKRKIWLVSFLIKARFREPKTSIIRRCLFSSRNKRSDRRSHPQHWPAPQHWTTPQH